LRTTTAFFQTWSSPCSFLANPTVPHARAKMSAPGYRTLNRQAEKDYPGFVSYVNPTGRWTSNGLQSSFDATLF
jgi:hypothetical protein